MSLGWRESTLDVDVKICPESDRVMRALVGLKESLELNIELASPADFIPEIEGWEGRSPFAAQEGSVAFYHYDLYAQALSKIERGHHQDIRDVREMVTRGLIDPRKTLDYFKRIEPELFRYPAIDSATFRKAVEETFKA